MKKPWKIINKTDVKNINQCIQDLKRAKIILSPWILDIVKNKKIKLKLQKKKVILYRLKLKYLGFNKPTSLKEVYKKIKKMNYNFVPVDVALRSRLYYKKIKKR